jgi:hypothetical protein
MRIIFAQAAWDTDRKAKREEQLKLLESNLLKLKGAGPRDLDVAVNDTIISLDVAGKDSASTIFEARSTYVLVRTAADRSFQPLVWTIPDL